MASSALITIHVVGPQAHSTENLYRTTASAVTRVSDDFYPRQPASHTVHLGVCAYNSLFIGPLLLPDWVRGACVSLK
jgi:raffinose synthase